MSGHDVAVSGLNISTSGLPASRPTNLDGQGSAVNVPMMPPSGLQSGPSFPPDLPFTASRSQKHRSKPYYQQKLSAAVTARSPHLSPISARSRLNYRRPQVFAEGIRPFGAKHCKGWGG